LICKWIFHHLMIKKKRTGEIKEKRLRLCIVEYVDKDSRERERKLKITRNKTKNKTKKETKKTNDARTMHPDAESIRRI